MPYVVNFILSSMASEEVRFLSMTKKDYVKIASSIESILRRVKLSSFDRAILIGEFCLMLKRDNPRFDSVRFVDEISE